MQEAARLERQRHQEESLREQQRRDAEARQERDRQAEQAREMAKRLLLAQQFKKSAVYAGAQKAAKNIMDGLRIDMIGEDSAYRGISKRSQASCNLLGILVKVEAQMKGIEASQDIGRVLAAADRDLVLEDSAIRAIYKNDQVFMELLGIWCKVIQTPKFNLASAYERISAAATEKTRFDDSAPRAICAYSEASVAILQEIVKGRGLAEQAKLIVSTIDSENRFDSSTWRVAMNNSKGNMNLLLALLEQVKPSAAKEIRDRITSSVLFDDSALRAQGQYKQGIIDALYQLIESL